MKLPLARLSLALAAALVTVAATACGTGSGAGQAGNRPISGGTFVGVINDDPGSLDPLTGVSPTQRLLATYAYEALVYAEPDGEVVPWLATKWTESAKKVTFTLHDGITCSDGSPFTAQTAANNLNHHADPDNGTFYYDNKASEKLSASAEGNTLTVTSSATDPFLLVNTGTIELVCQAGLDNPKTLVDATNGTGLYALSDIAAGDTYTYAKRDTYTWGPKGITDKTKGLPDELTLRAIAEEATAVNLLLSKQVNSAAITGPDKERLEAAGLDKVGERNPAGEMLFNERPDRPTSDPLVRRALTLALDREEIGDVVTGGDAKPSRSLVVKLPLLCVEGGPRWKLPRTDVEKAGRLLDQAGWKLGAGGKRTKNGQPLTIRFVYDAPTASHGPAAELVQRTWNTLGVTTKLVANDSNAWSEQLFKTFDWDTGWIQVAPGGPAVLSSFFAGKTPDEGGNNFMFVDNPEYEALVEQAASSTPGRACGLYQQAEAELIERVDAFPMADNELSTYLNGSVVKDSTYPRPPMIRMVG